MVYAKVAEDVDRSLLIGPSRQRRPPGLSHATHGRALADGQTLGRECSSPPYG